MDKMDEKRWWLAVYRGGKRVSIFLDSRTRITRHIAEDDLGLKVGFGGLANAHDQAIVYQLTIH